MAQDDFLAAFMGLASAMGGGGNEGNAVPIDDALDFQKGARYIPGEVTMARRKGEHVVFCPEDHKWRMEDGTWVE